MIFFPVACPLKNEQDDDRELMQDLAQRIDVNLYDILSAYQRHVRQAESVRPMRLRLPSYPIEKAVEQLKAYFTTTKKESSLTALTQCLAIDDDVSLKTRLIVLFNACLELNRQGFLSLRQIDDDLAIAKTMDK